MNSHYELKTLTLAEHDLSKPLTSKGERPIFGKTCTTQTGFPLHWAVNNSNALKIALKKAPGAVGLTDVKISSETVVMGVYNKMCLEVAGTPIYN